MTLHCDHPAKCSRPRRFHTLTQTTLIKKSGFLSLSIHPRETRLHRTPLPHAVRRIANTATFSTNDISLTTFLRFPPEIRIQIYRLLLKRCREIEYGVCVVSQRIIARRPYYRHRPTRHELFPSIMETCRLINREASTVLYGENWFSVERGEQSKRCPVIGSWALGSMKFSSITMLGLGYVPPNDSGASGCGMLEMMNLVPGLREVKILFRDVFPDQFERFLRITSDKLVSLQKATLEIDVCDVVGYDICNSRWSESLCSDQDRCYWTYQEPFKKYEDYWRNRKVRWQFDECDSEARCYCAMGTVWVFLE